ncbi:MAG: M48 family metallopeptidase [Pseudomonadota bacterium]
MATPVIRMSRRDIIRGLATGAVVVTAEGCVYNEELGRRQLLVVSDSQIASLAAQAWSQQKQAERVSTDPRYTSRMNRVAERVIRASGENPMEWEYLVFESQAVNAFALPGKKVGFYTGILDIMDNDDQIAVVMGHEVGHIRYRHSIERYSQSALSSQVIEATGVGQSDSVAAQLAGFFGTQAVQIGFLLPFSRKHELEADRFGLRAMHTAGYQANESIRFWEKMLAFGSTTPTFLSTHPCDETRIAQLQREIALLPPR